MFLNIVYMNNAHIYIIRLLHHTLFKLKPQILSNLNFLTKKKKGIIGIWWAFVIFDSREHSQ